MDQAEAIHSTITSPWVNTGEFYHYVHNYYMWLDIEPKTLDSGEIYSYIFWNLERYRAFLLYCKEWDCSFKDFGTNPHVWKAAFLLAFEQIRFFISDGVSTDVWEILGGKADELLLRFANARIPWTSQQYLNALMSSMYQGTPINNKWEIIYRLWDIDGIHRVYSFESGLHFVDNIGTIVEPETKNKIDRREIREEIEGIKEILELTLRENHDGGEIMKICEWKERYMKDTWNIWSWSNEDIIKMRLWLWQQILELELIFDELQKFETGCWWLEVTWWTVMWDGDGKRAYPWETPHRVWLIRAVS